MTRTSDPRAGFSLLCLATGLAVLAAPAFAQSDAPPAPRAQAFIRALRSQPDAVFEVEIDGPAVLRERFAETAAAGLLEIDTIAEGLEVLMTQVEAEATALEWDAIKQMLAYRGRVSVFFFARSEHDIGPFLAVVPPDGEMDTELFVELLDETIENGDEAPIFVEVAGRELTLLREGPDEPLSTLVRTEDGALLLIGVDPQLGPVEEQLARVLNLFDGLDDEKSSATGTSTSTSDDSSAAIVFRVLPGIGGLFLEGMRSGQQDPSEMETALEALRALGADRLRGYDVMVRAEGSRIRIDSALHVDPGAAGEADVLERLDPVDAGRVSLVELAPRDRFGWATIRLDLFGTLLGMLPTITRLDPNGFDSQENLRAMSQQLGFDAVDDLLPSLGSEWLFALPPEAIEFESLMFSPTALVDGFLIGLSLRDAERVRTCLNAALDTLGLTQARRTSTYRDMDVTTLPIAGLLPLTYAITDDVLLVSFGREGDDVVREALDHVADRRDGKEPAPFAPAIEERIEAAPPGWRSLGVAEIGLGFLLDAARMAPEEIADDTEEAFALLETLDAELRRLGLDHAVQLTYRTRDELRSVWIW
jgi:hypothetical protein